MTDVWWVGPGNSKTISSADWLGLGIIADTVSWNADNGWSVTDILFNDDQLDILQNDGEFVLGQSGPRLYKPPVTAGDARSSAYLYAKKTQDLYDELLPLIDDSGNPVISSWGSISGRPARLVTGPNVANGYAGLDGTGKVDSSQLPSYVDDVLEYANQGAFPGTGESGKIYVAIDTRDSFRWTGSAYARISDRVTASGITDSSSTGRTILTGDPAAGQSALDVVGRDTYSYYTKDHGILSDGTTNDLSALNALITAISSAGGGKILLPADSTTKVNGSIVMKSNVTLQGQGWHSIVKLGASINGFGVINISGAVSNIAVKDLKIECDRSTYTQAVYGISGSAPGGYSNVLIENVWVNSPQQVGILFLGDTTRTIETKNIKIIECKVTDAGWTGINAQWGVDQCWIERCSVIGHSLVASPGDGPGIVNGRQAYDTHINDCYVDSTGALGEQPHSISYDTAYGRWTCHGNTVVNAAAFGIEVAFCTDGSVIGNSVTGGAKAGIKLTNDELKATSLGVIVANNTLDGCAGGIEFFTGNLSAPNVSLAFPPSRTVLRNAPYVSTGVVQRIIDGRRVYYCSTAGTTHATVKPVSWGSTNAGDTITDGTAVFTDVGMLATAIHIQGNIIRNITGTNHGEGCGILVRYAALVNICGNTIINCAMSGIYLDSTANMVEIWDNVIQGNNSLLDAAHAGLRIIAYSGAAHVGKIGPNRFLNNSVGDVVVTDSVSGSRIDNRIPAGATVPTVAYGVVFFTQNTAPTSITGASDANAHDTDSKIIYIRVNDAFTTFVHSSSGSNTFRLAGGVDYLATIGSLIRFIFSSSLNQWVELSRTGIDGSWSGPISLELGHATDTTISRVSAGKIAVEGDTVVTENSINTIINKTFTSPKVNILKDTSGNDCLTLSPSASAVNNIILANAAASGYPSFTAAGTDTHVGIAAVMKGAGSLVISVPTGRTPTVEAKGADSNHDLNLLPKGTGIVKSSGNPVGVKVAVPATSSATGVAGQWAADSSWHYDCIAANTWVRSAAATW